MKGIKQILAAFSIALLVVSCSKIKGEGPVVTQERTLPAFNGVVLKVPGRTIITQGTDFKVELTAQENILDEIETMMSGSDLVFKFRNNNTNISSHDEPVFRITMPEIIKAEMHGSGDLSAAAMPDVSSLQLLVNGSGNIDIASVVGENLRAKTNGSGKIRVRGGSADTGFFEISGSGDIEVADVVTKQSEVHISGSGKVQVQASETLDVSISGSGKVKYRGNPVVNSNVSGSGSVGRL